MGTDFILAGIAFALIWIAFSLSIIASEIKRRNK